MSSRPFVNGFWDHLRIFWSTDRVNAWMSEIFENDKPYESCKNLITLSPDVHRAWQKALFALKPISLSADETRLELQLFWMPKYKHSRLIDPCRVPDPMAGLSSAGEWKLFDYKVEGLIRSGHTIIMETDDPDNKPLPSIHLLDMQWTLQCLTNMSAAGEEEDPSPFDDDDEDVDYPTYRAEYCRDSSPDVELETQSSTPSRAPPAESETDA
jgi:hypothetical protein